MNTKPGGKAGALVGGLLMSALLSTMYPLNIAFNLPFVPFDVFAWLVRSLPGRLIVTSLEAMVALLHLFRLPLDTAGKVAEFMMAIGLYIGVGALAGALVYAFSRKQEANNNAPGIVAGLLLAAPVALLVGLEPLSPARLFDPFYVMLAFGVWGLALSWVYTQLITLPPEHVQRTQLRNPDSHKHADRRE